MFPRAIFSRQPFSFLVSKVPAAVYVVLVLAFSIAGAAQLALTSPLRSDSAARELQLRLDGLEQAKRSEDPEKIDVASRGVVALGLRQVASLRLLQGAFPQAAELYKRSLDFEEIPDTHVDLAVAYMRGKLPDKALSEAANAILSDAQNFRAWHVQGKTWMMKKDYQHAAESLARSISMHPDLDAAYALAISFLQLHQKDKAAAVFQQMIEVGGDRAGLHVLFGRAYRDAELMQDAVREFNRAIAMDARSTHAHYFLGLAYLIRNEWRPTADARQQFLEEIVLNPKDFFGNYFMGVITSGEKDYAASDHYLTVAATDKPEWPEPWLYLGLNASGRGENEAAETLLRKAIQLTGNDESRNNYQIRRAYFVLGRLLSAKGKREEAALAMQRAREMEAKTLAESHQKIAAMGGASKLEVADIVDDTSDVAFDHVLDPASKLDAQTLARANLTDSEKEEANIREQQLRSVLGSAFNDLATSEARRQQYGLALAHFREAERWEPRTPGLLRNIGIAAVRVNNYSQAAEVLRKVVAENPQDTLARSLLGLSLFMTDQYVEAAQAFAPIRKLVVKDPGLGYAWATSLIRTNQNKEAASILEELERQEFTADTLVLIGQSWADMGDNLHALTVFRKALAQNASIPKAHYYSGLALIRLDQPAGAAAEFRFELARDPHDADTQYHLGFALLQESKSAEAKKILTDLLLSYPDHAEAHYQLGKLLLDEGNIVQAVPHLETAARLSPDKDYVHYQLQAAYRRQSRPQDAERELKLYREIKERNRERTAAQPVAIPQLAQH